MTRRRPKQVTRRSSGFTLLEVILALGILAAALAVLGEVSRLSQQNAQLASLQARAAVVAESVLAELEAGTAELVNFSGDWLDLEDGQAEAEWRYSVTIEPTAFEEILQARIIVEEVRPATETPLRLTVIRWFQDPEYLSSAQSSVASQGF